MDQQHLLKKCFESTNEFIEIIIKFFDDTLQFRNYFMEEGNNLSNFLNNVSFENIKSKYKDYSESLSSIQSWIEGIKIKKDQINYFITQYENFRDLDNYIEIYNQMNEERTIFEGYPEFCDEKVRSCALSEKEIITKKRQKINFEYCYSISFCSKSNINSNSDFNSIIQELKNSNSNNKMCFSKIHKNIYINDIIKSNKFEDDNIISKYISEFPKINEIKSVEDFLIQQCKIKKDDLDYRGNAIYFNLSQNNKRGQEKYDPPHGCISIGLKSIRKYENDDWLHNNSETSRWAIAYHGIGNLSKYKDIKEMIFNIIKNGLKPGNSQDKMGQKDKRHPQETIGEGVYLYPTFKDAEENAGIVYIKQKKYKIILMTRVLIEKISEPEDAKQWILNTDDIRIYRVLAKKVE